MQEDRSGLTCLIDWVQFTVKTLTLKEVYSLLGMYESEFVDMPRGLYGYPMQKACGDIRILYGGGENMGIHVQLSGQGCREFETYWHMTWEEMLGNVIQADGEFTRFDLAVDEIRYDGKRPYFTVKKVMQKTEKGHCRSKFRNAIEIKKIEIKDGAEKGNTIYFGSPQSNIQIRIYEKNFERENAGKEVEQRITTWNRTEMQMADERAQEAVKQILRGVEVGVVMFGLLRNYMNFVDPTEDSNKARWPISEWWLLFLDDAERLRLAAKAPDSTIERKEQWVDKQVKPTLSEIWVALGRPGGDWFVDLINDGLERMTDAQWQRAEEFRERWLQDQHDTNERREVRRAAQLAAYGEVLERYREAAVTKEKEAVGAAPSHR